jgi:hypothetical protein
MVESVKLVDPVVVMTILVVLVVTCLVGKGVPTRHSFSASLLISVVIREPLELLNGLKRRTQSSGLANARTKVLFVMTGARFRIEL